MFILLLVVTKTPFVYKYVTKVSGIIWTLMEQTDMRAASEPGLESD